MEIEAVLLTGWLCRQNSAWLSWLVDELATRRIKTHWQPLPHHYLPTTASGVRLAKRLAAEVSADRELAIFCHSFGGRVALQAIPQLKQPVCELVLVAPLYRWPLTTHWPFWTGRLDGQALVDHCRHVTIVHSRDDNVVPFQNGQRLADALAGYGLSVEFIGLDRCGHFCPPTCETIPELVPILNRLSG